MVFQPISRSNDTYFTNLAIASARSITIIHQPLINYRFNNRLQKKQSDIILTNRISDELQDVTKKIYTRDLFARD